MRRWALVLALLAVGCEREVVIARLLDGATAIDPCPGAPPEWLFCSQLEEGDLSRWDDADGNPSETTSLVEDPGPADRAGNHVVRLLPPPGRGNADLVAELPPHAGPIWARWYAYWEPGFDFTVGQRGAGFHAGDRTWLGASGRRPSGEDFFDVLVGPSATGTAELTSYSRGMYQDCVDPLTTCFADRLPCTSGATFCTRPEDLPARPLVALVAGRWTCVELFVDPGAPSASATDTNGVIDAWIDGAELGPFDARWLRTTDALAPSVLWLNVFLDGDHPNAGLRIDDVVVSTARVGC